MRYIDESVYVSHSVAIPISYINLGCDIRTKCVFGEIGRFRRIYTVSETSSIVIRKPNLRPNSVDPRHVLS